MMMHDCMSAGHLVWMLVVAVLVVVPFWRICRKAGFPGALSLLILVPLVNLVFLYVLAFSGWPSQQRGSSLNDG